MVERSSSTVQPMIMQPVITLKIQLADLLSSSLSLSSFNHVLGFPLILLVLLLLKFLNQLCRFDFSPCLGMPHPACKLLLLPYRKSPLHRLSARFHCTLLLQGGVMGLVGGRLRASELKPGLLLWY